MAHEAVNEADVEPVQTQPVGGQPDRDVPGCTDQFALPCGRKSKTLQMLRIASDYTAIPFRNHIGQ